MILGIGKAANIISKGHWGEEANRGRISCVEVWMEAMVVDEQDGKAARLQCWVAAGLRQNVSSVEPGGSCNYVGVDACVLQGVQGRASFLCGCGCLFFTGWAALGEEAGTPCEGDGGWAWRLGPAPCEGDGGWATPKAPPGDGGWARRLSHP